MAGRAQDGQRADLSSSRLAVDGQDQKQDKTENSMGGSNKISGQRMDFKYRKTGEFRSSPCNGGGGIIIIIIKYSSFSTLRYITIYCRFENNMRDCSVHV